MYISVLKKFAVLFNDNLLKMKTVRKASGNFRNSCQRITVHCILFLVLAGIFCPRIFAQAIDCDKAIEVCDERCAEKQIYDYGRDGYLKQSDFVKRCQDACFAGLKPCLKQDSENNCSTYNYHCTSNCPWSVIDTDSDLPVRYSDSFKQCANACSGGSLECRSFNKNLPPRKRAGELNGCAQAQVACYSNCGTDNPRDQNSGAEVKDSNYPYICAAACVQGISACKALTESDAQCEEFFDKCFPDCSDSITNGNGSKLTNTDGHLLCVEACRAGRMFCRDIFHLPVLDEDIEALEKHYEF